MRLLDLKFHFLVISIVITLLPACTPKNNDHQESLSGVPELITASPVSSLLPVSTSSSQLPPINNPSPIPNVVITQQLTPQTTAVTENQEPLEIAWRDVPIMPLVSQRVLQIYQDGQAQGRNPHNFSVIGDCQAIPFVFMGPFERAELEPDSAESNLWNAINQFKGSFVRQGMAVRGGFTAASILSPIQADPHFCIPGETPLTCEYRLHNPAFVLITLETWLDPNTVDRYEIYLRKILDYVIERGTVPILLTKADSSELRSRTHVINPAIMRVARDYDVPVINFWRAAQYLDNYGIDPAREGFHLSQEGYDLKNILALRTLYTVWKAVESGVSSSTNNGNDDQGNSTATPTLQTTPISQPSPLVTVPDCDGGCIFFATASSQDGVVTSQGVLAYNYSTQTLTSVLDEDYDLQDVSEDGKRLLVNTTNRLYEINLANASANLVSDSFFSLGKQGAYWNSDDSAIILIDQNNSFQTETGGAFNLFPSTRDEERYFESGSCTSKDSCQFSGVYRLNSDQSATRLDSYSRLVFSPNGKLVGFLNPAAATRYNYYHISYILLEETERGISSRRVFYFPEEGGFMVYPDVHEYAFSPENNKLFIIYDVYSAYYEESLRIQTYMIDINTGILYDFGSINGISGSLNPRMVWAPQGNKILFFLTDETQDNQYSISIFQTNLDAGEKLTLYDQGIMISSDYFYITNLYWR
jgi:hypothetical protein